MILKLLKRWSGRPGSNRRRPAWEAGILPLNYSRLAYFLYPSVLKGFRPLNRDSFPSIASIEKPWILTVIWTVKAKARPPRFSFTFHPATFTISHWTSHPVASTASRVRDTEMVHGGFSFFVTYF